jgi:hypothetical protein
MILGVDKIRIKIKIKNKIEIRNRRDGMVVNRPVGLRALNQ